MPFMPAVPSTAERRHSRHEAVMSCKEDILELCEAGDQEVDDQTDNEDGHRLYAEHLLCHGHDRFVVRDNAGDMEALLNHLAEGIQIFYDETCAGSEH